MGMIKQKKSWQDKLGEAKNLPRVEKIPERMIKRWGKGSIVIPSPTEVDGIVRSIPKGRLMTINDIREILAKRHHATMACPMATGMFVWIVANAAHEAHTQGKKRITPYWRILKTGGELNSKFPGGIQAHKVQLEAEGHQVVRKGKRHIVRNYENCLRKT